MAQKKKSKKRKRRPRSAGDAGLPERVKFARRTDLNSATPIEATNARIERMLDARNFESMEEANAFLQTILGPEGTPIENEPPRTPLEEAQDLMYEAWEAPRRRAAKLARKALEISPDCADAYVVLAQTTGKTAAQQAELYQEGVRAGERALGEAAFVEEAGHFWDLVDTRPYMRALGGLAQCLFALGRTQEAAENYIELLRLDPMDHQASRYWLAACLLDLEEHDALRSLLDRYKDDVSADWFYTRALLRFRREKDSTNADRAFIKALNYNPFVPLYLLGLREVPEDPPPFVSPGEEDEAIEYTVRGIKPWAETPGALDWVADIMEAVITQHGQNKAAGKGSRSGRTNR